MLAVCRDLRWVLVMVVVFIAELCFWVEFESRLDRLVFHYLAYPKEVLVFLEDQFYLSPVLLPIILPTLVAFNIDLVHFGVLMVIAVVIGQVTPPMAIALIIASKIAQVDQIRVLKANTPFFLGIVVFMLIAIAIPGLATWLPELMRN